MDYEKNKEALEIVRQMVSDGQVAQDVAEKYFPELKESEDERIRKAISQCVEDMRGQFEKLYSVHHKDAIAWLEKQGEKKPVNNVEPKFKVGDWIVSPNRVYWHIDAIQNGRYEVTADTGQCGNWPLDTNIYRLWTIQDAKAGDVLCCENGWTCIFKALDNHKNTYSSYCFMDSDKWFCNAGSEGHTLNEQFIKAYNSELHPATKEQRDLLFQKMKEAGYEWYAEKKELRKIEQKPAMSKEDEYYYGVIQYILNNECVGKTDKENAIKWLKSLKNRVQPKQEWGEEDEMHRHWILEMLKDGEIKTPEFADHFKAAFNWLKSLRPQNTWKPTQIQISALEWQVANTYQGSWQYNSTKELLEQLKAL